MEVRVLTAADAAAFQALRLQGLLECPLAFASSHEEEVATPLATIAERLTPQVDRVVVGAFTEPGLVGVVGLQRESFKKLAHKALLWGMYVAPQARRAGAGRRLVMAALAFAAGPLGVGRVTLCVNAKNAAAIALYASLGFEPFGVEPGSMLLDGELHDEMYMVCVLPH